MKAKLVILIGMVFSMINIASSQSNCIEEHKHGMLVKYKELSSIEGIWMSSQSYVYKYVNGNLSKKDVLTGTTLFDYMILLQPGEKFVMIKTDDCKVAYGFRGFAVFRPTPDPNLYIGLNGTQTFNATVNGNKLTYKVREDYKNIQKEFGKRAADMIDIEFEINLIKIFPTEKDYQNFINK